MTDAVVDPTFKKLTAELLRAEASALYALDRYGRKVPGALLVVFKQRYEFSSVAHPLYDPGTLDVSVMAALREGLRVAAKEAAKRPVAKVACVISMIEMDDADLSFWLEKGFFPKAKVPSSFVGKDLALFTASNASGQVVRRLSQIVSSPVLLMEGSRQLCRSVQVEMANEPSEMDVFWSTYKTAKKRLLEDG